MIALKDLDISIRIGSQFSLMLVLGCKYRLYSSAWSTEVLSGLCAIHIYASP